jgi:hypothetical protein
VRALASVLVVALLLGASRAEAQPSPAAPPPAAAPAAGPPDAGLLGAGQPQISLPPPAALTPEQLRTVKRLDEAKREDSGRGLDWVWADVNAGFEQLGMQALSGGDQGFVGGFVKTSSSGGALGAAVGARLLFFTLLLRGRIGVFDSGQLYRVGPEAGVHVPLGRFEPRAALGLGYAAVGNLHDTVGGMAASYLALRGFYSRLSAGLDYYPTPAVSIGADLSGDLLVLVRPALNMAQVSLIKGFDATQHTRSDLLSSTGTGVGGTIALTAVAGFHF